MNALLKSNGHIGLHVYLHEKLNKYKDIGWTALFGVVFFFLPLDCHSVLFHLRSLFHFFLPFHFKLCINLREMAGYEGRLRFPSTFLFIVKLFYVNKYTHTKYSIFTTVFFVANWIFAQVYRKYKVFCDYAKDVIWISPRTLAADFQALFKMIDWKYCPV